VLFSKSCIYGLRATIYIASQKDREFVPISEIADKLQISFHFLTKILQNLTKFKLMKSYRGPKGGISLDRPAHEIRVSDIIEALDCEDFLSSCILGLPDCSDENPCPFHENWKIERERIKQKFLNVRLDELSDSIINSGLRLSP